MGNLFKTLQNGEALKILFSSTSRLPQFAAEKCIEKQQNGEQVQTPANWGSFIKASKWGTNLESCKLGKPSKCSNRGDPRLLEFHAFKTHILGKRR